MIALEEEGRWSGVAEGLEEGKEIEDATATAISPPASLTCQRVGRGRLTINAGSERGTYG